MHRLSEYERRAFQEIEASNAPGKGVLSRAISYVSDTKAIRWVAGHAPPIPVSITRPVLKSVQGFLEVLKDGSFWTYSDQVILRAARRETND